MASPVEHLLTIVNRTKVPQRRGWKIIVPGGYLLQAGSLGELFQIVRAEDVRSLLLGHCTLSYFDLQEILQIEEHAEASVDSPVIYGNCKVCGELGTLSCWDSNVGGRACEECCGSLEE